MTQVPTSPAHGRRSRVTLQTLADELGVSRTTVSNAWNRPDQLTSELRERILALAQERGYPGPNATARSLRRGRSGAVGLLLTETLTYAFTDPAAVALLRGIAEASEAAGVSLLLIPAPASPEVPDETEAVRSAIVDGFVTCSVPCDDDRLLVTLGRGQPVVLIDQHPQPGTARVRIDDARAAEQAAEHLLALGHRRFGVVALPFYSDGVSGFAEPQRQTTSTSWIARERLKGYAQALGRAGINWNRIPVWECSENSRPAGAHAARQVLTHPSRPTALLVMSDQLALGAMRAVEDLGLQVPDDVSIIGFDDIPAAAQAEPPLTTIRQPMLEKGRAAGRLIVEGWDPSVAPDVVFDTTVMVRGTTAAPDRGRQANTLAVPRKGA